MSREEVQLIMLGLFWLQLTASALTFLTDDIRKYVYLPGAGNANEAKGMLTVIVGMLTCALFSFFAIYTCIMDI